MTKRLITWVTCCMFWVACGQKEMEGEEKTGNDTLTGVAEKNNKVSSAIADGPYKEHYPGGELKIEGTMSAGRKEGEWKSYYPNGTPYSTNNYAGGELNGKTVTYYPNGQIRYIGYYANGKPSGKWLIFNDKGEQVEEKEYK